MNRPSMDTNHVPEDEKDLNDSVSEAPSTSRVWASQLVAVILLAAGVYALCRGAVEYPATADESRQLRSSLGQADLSLTHLGTSGADWGASVRTWREKTAERYGVVRLHLLGCYGMIALGPLALFFSTVVWWRGQFPRPAGRFPLDRTQIAMNVGALVLLAGLRIFDSATSTVMAKTPVVSDLQAFLKMPTPEQKTRRLAAIRTELEQTLRKIQDKKSTPAARAAAARTVSAAAWDKLFVATLSDEDKKSIRASLTEFVKKTYTEDDSCPVLIRAIGAFGDPAVAEALETEREKSRPNWVDVKRPEGIRCFFAAVGAGRLADVRKLVERGMNVNVVSPSERHTALHEAVLRRQHKVAEFLLQKGGKTDIAGENVGQVAEKEYPLHRAVGDARLVQMLLEKGADPSVLDLRGQTPLHRAALAADVESAELLLARKVKLNALDFSRRTPLDLVADSQAPKAQATTMRNTLVQRGALTSAQLQPKNSAEAAVSPNAR